MRIWMAGMTCLNCGKGRYIGYQAYPMRKTLPCEVCGDVRPVSMTSQEFLDIVKTRDALLKDVRLVQSND